MKWSIFQMLSHVFIIVAFSINIASTSTTSPMALSATTTTKSERQKVLDALLKDYDSRIPPNYEDDFPVEVEVQLHITNIDSISETNMEFTFGAFIRQIWRDDRLIYKKLPRLRSLELDSKFMDKVWVPDLFLANEKAAHFHIVTVPNKLMHIYPDGKILYSVRVTATLKCNMDLRKYPLDTQECSVFMESYAYSTENLNFNWNSIPVIKDPMLILPQFYLGEFHALRCDKQYHELNYTCVELRFELMRSLGYYMTQVYIPSILIVILSWLSFWLDKDAVPARISLGLLTVLTMTTQSAGARASLPKVSYAKGIDVWMAACLIFVFAALIEFAYVNVLSRVQKRHRKDMTEKANHEIKENNAVNRDVVIRKGIFNMFLPSEDKARTLDRISRSVFPLSFGVFNLIYWLVYIFWVPDRDSIH
ncbi:Glycine receptor subunit alpha-3 [Mactra antiquata]